MQLTIRPSSKLHRFHATCGQGALWLDSGHIRDEKRGKIGNIGRVLWSKSHKESVQRAFSILASEILG